MATSLFAVLFTVFSQLSPAVDWIVFAGARLAAAQDATDIGEPVAVVQVDVLPDVLAAERLAIQLELVADGELDVFIELLPSDFEGFPPSYVVNVGPFDDFEAAEHARAKLEAAGIDGFVTELDPLGC